MNLADLDRVIETLERLEAVTPPDDDRIGSWTGATVRGDLRAALTLLRQMRANAVEGWVESLEEWHYATQAERLDYDGVLKVWANPYRLRDTPALLILTPKDD